MFIATGHTVLRTHGPEQSTERHCAIFKNRYLCVWNRCKNYNSREINSQLLFLLLLLCGKYVVARCHRYDRKLCHCVVCVCVCVYMCCVYVCARLVYVWLFCCFFELLPLSASQKQKVKRAIKQFKLIKNVS